MEINASKRGPRLHVKLSGELDHHSAEQTRNMLDTLLKDITVRDLTLDLYLPHVGRLRHRGQSVRRRVWITGWS